MKVNRYGMSQKIFMQMVKAWAVGQVMNAARMLVREGKVDECEKIINEADDVLKKTFLEQDPDAEEFLKTIADLRTRINLERAGQAPTAARPS